MPESRPYVDILDETLKYPAEAADYLNASLEALLDTLGFRLSITLKETG